MRKVKHIGVVVNGNCDWAKAHKQDLAKAFRRGFKNLKSIIEQQIKLNIPIMTVYVLPSKMENPDQLFVIVDTLSEFMHYLMNDGILDKNKVKVSVFGKWYDMPARLVDPIKNLITTTRDYDRLFLNFCINYDGEEEIVDALKLLARQVKAEKIDVDMIKKSAIKENIYSPFMPPDMIIVTGKEPKLSSFLLWDSAYSDIYFTHKLWPDFTKGMFNKALKTVK